MRNAQRRNLVRKQRRLQKLGTPYPVCALCGFAHPAALERHHPLGRKSYPDDVVILCRNCHALVTEMERDAGLLLRASSEDTLIELLTRAMAWANLVRHTIAIAPKILARLEQGFNSLAASNNIPIPLREPLGRLLDALRNLVQEEPPAAAGVREAVEEVRAALEEVYHALAACDPTRHQQLLELLRALGVQAEAGNDASR